MLNFQGITIQSFNTSINIFLFTTMTISNLSINNVNSLKKLLLHKIMYLLKIITIDCRTQNVDVKQTFLVLMCISKKFDEKKKYLYLFSSRIYLK